MIDLSFAIVVALIIAGSGNLILKKSKFSFFSSLETHLFSFAFMYGLTGVIIFILGVLGLLTKPFLVIVLLIELIMAGINYGFYKKLFEHVRRVLLGLSRGKLEMAVYPVIAVFFVVTTLISMAPISSMDSLKYHFALPKLYLSGGEILNVPGYLYAHLPQMSEMINLFIMSLKSDVSANVFNSFMSLLSSLAVFMTAKKFFDRKTALISALLFYCSLFTLWIATGSYPGMHTAFFCLLSLYGLLLYKDKTGKSYLILSAVFLGFALQLKMQALMFFVSLALIFIAYRLCTKCLRRKYLKGIFLWILVVVTVGSPWYIFNCLTTGNPFFPMLWNLLGGAHWNETANRILESSLNVYGYGKSFLDWILVPFRLTWYGTSFDNGHLLGPLFLMFIPFSFLKKKDLSNALLLLGVSFLYSVIWFLFSQQARFLMPVIPLLAILTALGYLNVVSLASKFLTGLSKNLISAFIIFNLAGAVFVSSNYIKVVTGLEKREKFLSRSVWGYTTIAWMNSNLSPRDKILFSGFGPYYLDIPYYVANTTLQGLIDYSAYGQGKDLYDRLKDLGFTHIYVWGDSLHTTNLQLWKEFKTDYLEKIFEDRKIMSSKRSLGRNDIIEKTAVYRIK